MKCVTITLDVSGFFFSASSEMLWIKVFEFVFRELYLYWRVGLLDYGKNHNPDCFGQYWNHDYSNDYFRENMMHLFSIALVLEKMTAASPDQRAIYDWLGLVTARLHARLFQKTSRPNSTTENAKIIVSTQ